MARTKLQRFNYGVLFCLLAVLCITGLLVSSFSLYFKFTRTTPENDKHSLPPPRRIAPSISITSLTDDSAPNKDNASLLDNEDDDEDKEDFFPLELLNKLPLQIIPSAQDQHIVRYFFTQPLAKLVSRKALQERYTLYYQRDQKRDLFSYYNPKYQYYRSLFALDDVHALRLAWHYREIAKEFQTTMPLEQMELVLNKERFTQWLMAHGFKDNVPRLYTNIESVTFPVIVKVPVNTTASFGVFLAANRSHLDGITARLERSNTPYFLQEYIQGALERIVHVVAIHGRLVRMVCHERKLDGMIYQFVSNPNKWRRTPPHVDLAKCHRALFENIVRELNFNGIGNFDVKVDANNVVRIFEFNPRVPGTILRDARLMGEFFCAMQWEGNGILSPKGGCEYTKGSFTVVK